MHIFHFYNCNAELSFRMHQQSHFPADCVLNKVSELDSVVYIHGFLPIIFLGGSNGVMSRGANCQYRTR